MLRIHCSSCILQVQQGNPKGSCTLVADTLRRQPIPIERCLIFAKTMYLLVWQMWDGLRDTVTSYLVRCRMEVPHSCLVLLRCTQMQVAIGIWLSATRLPFSIQPQRQYVRLLPTGNRSLRNTIRRHYACLALLENQLIRLPGNGITMLSERRGVCLWIRGGKPRPVGFLFLQLHPQLQ